MDFCELNIVVSLCMDLPARTDHELEQIIMKINEYDSFLQDLSDVVMKTRASRMRPYCDTRLGFKPKYQDNDTEKGTPRKKTNKSGRDSDKVHEKVPSRIQKKSGKTHTKRKF